MDKRLHMDMLNELTEEIGKRCYGGQVVLPEGVGLQLFDAFARCGVP